MANLGDPFIEGAQRFFCGNIFVEAGIGSAGLAALKASNPLAGAGVALVAVAYSEFCRQEFNPDVHLPKEPAFTGGQCPVNYRVRALCVVRPNGDAPRQRYYSNENIPGPLGNLIWQPSAPLPPEPGSVFWDLRIANPEGTRGLVPEATDGYGFGSGPHRARSGGGIVSVVVTRMDNAADNCGSLPSTPIPIIPQPNLKPRTVNHPFIVPAPGGDKAISLPLTLVNFKLDKLFGDPKIEFNAGGVNISVDWSTDPPTISEPGVEELAEAIERLIESEAETSEQLAEILRQIRACVCTPAPEVEALFLPYATCGPEGASSQVKQFLVAKDTVSAEDVQAFEDSERLAIAGCRPELESVPPSLLASGASSFAQRIFYSPEVPIEVQSVILYLEDLAPHTRNLYVLAGDDSEGKFGHLSWSPSGENAASGGPFCWTLTTYFDLPKPRRPGRVRLSLKPNFSWELWDTGERLPPWPQ